MGKKKSENLTMLEDWSGIYFIDADDKEDSEILINARRKLEIPIAPAMPCKRMDKQHLSIVKPNGKLKIGTQKGVPNNVWLEWIPPSPRAESLQSKIHEDRIAGRGFTSFTHYNIGAQVHPDATCCENSRSQSCR